MNDASLDLVGLDRRLSRSHERIEKALLRIRRGETDPELEAFAQDFAGIRDLAGQSIFAALTDAVDEHRRGLARWSYELLQLRVAWDLVLDDVRAMRTVDPALERRGEEAPSKPKVVAESYAAALAALVGAEAFPAADLAFERLFELAEPVAAVRKELRGRRFEVSHRLGLAHPWQLVTKDGVAPLATLATRLLDATEPLAVELHKRVRRLALESPATSARRKAPSAAWSIHDAFARDAGEGWPARLGQRWFDDVFRALAPRRPKLPHAPAPLGAASFVRAAASWGAALRLAGTARSLPFALARDPYPTEAHVVGGAVAIALGSAAFARRKLGVSKRGGDGHVRGVARVLFNALRAMAGGILVAMRPPLESDLVEELGARIFGAPLPRALGAVWSYGSFSGALPVDLPARLLGATRAHAFAADLVARFDEDWFDNPRAGSHLASISAGPVFCGDVPEEAAVVAVVRAFEEALG
jgi:hypothetical protein